MKRWIGAGIASLGLAMTPGTLASSSFESVRTRALVEYGNGEILEVKTSADGADVTAISLTMKSGSWSIPHEFLSGLKNPDRHSLRLWHSIGADTGMMTVVQLSFDDKGTEDSITPVADRPEVDFLFHEGVLKHKRIKRKASQRSWGYQVTAINLRPNR
jgi:hypothetical protein